MKKRNTNLIVLPILVLCLAINIAFSMTINSDTADAASKRPAKVKGLSAKATTNSISLKWKKAKYSKKYQVYYKKSNIKKWSKKTTKRCSAKLKVSPNTKYSLKVRGIKGKKKGKFFAVKTVLTKSIKKKSTNNPQNNSNENKSPKTETNNAEMKLVTQGELHMATNAAFPPYEMTTNDGDFEGIDIEIAQLIANKIGLKLVIDDMDFASVVPSVQRGEEDIAMAAITITAERKGQVDFTDSYITNTQVVIVPKDSNISTIEDLKNNKIIGCKDGTTGYIYCSEPKSNGGFGEKNVLSYINGASTIQALLAGRVDAVVIDSKPAMKYVKANSGLRILNEEYVKENYAIGISKTNKPLYEAVNKAISELKQDGTIDKIEDKYITTE